MDEGQVDGAALRRIVAVIEPLLDATGERLDMTHSEEEYAAALSEVIATLVELDPHLLPGQRA